MKTTRNRSSIAYVFTIVFMFVLAFPPSALADWPTETQWIGVYKDNITLGDVNTDTNGSRNIVADPANDKYAAMVYYDGTYFYIRMRLDDDPSGQGGQGLLQPYGWGVEFDIDMDDSDFEWLTMLDGISKTESIRLFQNTVQGTLGDPGDQLEIEYTSIVLSGNLQIYPADTSINGDQDYWIAWRFPYATLKAALGITDYTPIRLFFGSSSAANTLSQNGADLVAPYPLDPNNITLADGLSDYILLTSGKSPTDGSVMFVESLTPVFGDMTTAGTGDTLYVKVEDDDRNADNAALDYVEVTLTVPSGDSETITLTETGVDTGIFTEDITNTFLLTPPYYTADNDILEAFPGETVTVTYVDGAAADLSLSVPRQDTLLLAPPILSVTKSVTPATVDSGDTVTYTITITNTGNGAAVVTSVEDILPAGFTNISGTVTGFTTDEPSVSGQTLTWTGTWAVPRKVGSNDGSITLTFDATAASYAGIYYNNVTVSGNNFTPVSTGDTAQVVVYAAPLMEIDKTVDKSSAYPGDELTYTVYYHNVGGGPAYNVIIMDSVPPNTTYVPGSLRIGDAGSTYSTATPVTDAPGDDEAEVSGSTLIFRFSPVTQDDGVPNSGTDEGKVYLMLKIDS